MKLPLYWVDAFTSEVFRGNPAAVVPLETWLPDGLMQRIAAENGLSETAFLVRTGPAHHHLRWFTPQVEIDLCGHATLGAAFALFHHLGQAGDAITFDSRSGPLLVRRRGDLLELDFPAQPPEPAESSAPLAQALGRSPRHFLRTKSRWLCVYEKATDVSGLQPDHASLARIVPGRITITAPGVDCDFVSRTFVPEAGIPEDPVTGSAHCALVPYWAARLGRPQLHARQVSARGGELFCERRGDRVAMAGHGVLYLQGEITV
ncbi:MAG TPA: PhzF family phenazine biosynthesis protein [Lacunisphaera sp.]|nr:PhzF family phenazine biosynthesis protein [Lacunisphaera sp.]